MEEFNLLTCGRLHICTFAHFDNRTLLHSVGSWELEAAGWRVLREFENWKTGEFEEMEDWKVRDLGRDFFFFFFGLVWFALLLGLRSMHTCHFSIKFYSIVSL